MFAAIFLIVTIVGPGAAKKEILRLENIEQEAIEALENGEYKKALLNAEALVYSPSVRNGDADELERQWDIKRELLIDRIIDEAIAHGVELEYIPKDNIESTSLNPEEAKFKGGFFTGFFQGLHNGFQSGVDGER